VPEFKRLENGRTITLKHENDTGVTWQIRNDAIFVIADLVADKEYLFLLEIDRGTVPITLSKRSTQTVQQHLPKRSSLEAKLFSIQKLLSVSDTVFTSLGERFSHFKGARVVVVTSSAKRVMNIINGVQLHSELLEKEAFLLSYFGETSTGAFGCRYAVPSIVGGKVVVGTKSIKNTLKIY
jgi:predicted PhzF superfamily epimerase YddE/YHI9